MPIIIIRSPIARSELAKFALSDVPTVAKAVIDVRQGIMALGGELHADEEVILSEQAGSLREDTWGVNLYIEKMGEDFIEFDSMVNLKPVFNNRSRNVESEAVRKKIKEIIGQLVL